MNIDIKIELETHVDGMEMERIEDGIANMLTNMGHNGEVLCKQTGNTTHTPKKSRTYRVLISSTVGGVVEVKATNRKDAKEKALQLVQEDGDAAIKDVTHRDIIFVQHLKD